MPQRPVKRGATRGGLTPGAPGVGSLPLCGTRLGAAATVIRVESSCSSASSISPLPPIWGLLLELACTGAQSTRSILAKLLLLCVLSVSEHSGSSVAASEDCAFSTVLTDRLVRPLPAVARAASSIVGARQRAAVLAAARRVCAAAWSQGSTSASEVDATARARKHAGASDGDWARLLQNTSAPGCNAAAVAQEAGARVGFGAQVWSAFVELVEHCGYTVESAELTRISTLRAFSGMQEARNMCARAKNANVHKCAHRL